MITSHDAIMWCHSPLPVSSIVVMFVAIPWWCARRAIEVGHLISAGGHLAILKIIAVMHGTHMYGVCLIRWRTLQHE